MQLSANRIIASIKFKCITTVLYTVPVFPGKWQIRVFSFSHYVRSIYLLSELCAASLAETK